MKKIFITIVAMFIFAMPNTHLIAGSGDTAAGVAAGLGIGMLGIAASQAGSGRARRAEEEARRAQDKADLVRQESQQNRMLDIQRQMERQQMIQRSSTMTNILIFAIIILFLAVLGLGAAVLMRRRR